MSVVLLTFICHLYLLAVFVDYEKIFWRFADSLLAVFKFDETHCRNTLCRFFIGSIRFPKIIILFISNNYSLMTYFQVFGTNYCRLEIGDTEIYTAFCRNYHLFPNQFRRICFPILPVLKSNLAQFASQICRNCTTLYMWLIQVTMRKLCFYGM